MALMKHDISVLRNCIKEGYCKELIMETMGIEADSTFNAVKLRLLEADKKYYNIPTRSDLLKRVKPVSVTKNRNIIIGKDILNICGFEMSDQFNLSFTRHGFTLTKIVDEPTPDDVVYGRVTEE